MRHLLGLAPRSHSPQRGRTVCLALLGLSSCMTPPSPLDCEVDECPCELFEDADASELPEGQAAFLVERDMVTTQYGWSEATGDAFVCRVLACDGDRVALEFRSGDLHLELATCGPIVASSRPVAQAEAVADCDDDASGWSLRFVDGDTYESVVGTELCTLHVRRDGLALTGNFECAAVQAASGELLRVSEGSFACAIEE
jgi:hypothetical protein